MPCHPNEGLASKKLSALLDSEIGVILNLLTTDEFEARRFTVGSFPNYSTLLKSIAESRKQKVTCLRFPIRDMGVPSKPQMIEMLDAIDKYIEKTIPVYFHCFAGLGRTGTVAGCWLVRHGMEGEEALKELTTLRTEQGTIAYGMSPQSEIQFDFVRSWNIGD